MQVPKRMVCSRSLRAKLRPIETTRYTCKALLVGYSIAHSEIRQTILSESFTWHASYKLCYKGRGGAGAGGGAFLRCGGAVVRCGCLVVEITLVSLATVAATGYLSRPGEK